MNHSVNVESMLERSKTLIVGYTQFTKHAPKLLRDSMILAYTTAVDDMLRAMDASRTETPVETKNMKRIVLLDENGFPA